MIALSKTELLAALDKRLTDDTTGKEVTSSVEVIGKRVSTLGFSANTVFVGELLLDKIKDDRSGHITLKFGTAPDEGQVTQRIITCLRSLDNSVNSGLVMFTSTLSENLTAIFNGYEVTLVDAS